MIKQGKIYDKKEIVQIVIALILIFCIIFPIIGLCNYANPAVDDFSFANTYSGNFEAYPEDVFLQQVIRNATVIYNTWQGTYLTNVLTSINPIVHFDSLAMQFKVVQILLMLFIIMFFAFLFVLVKTVISKIYECKKLSIVLWMYLAIVFLTTQYTNLSENFYWFTGAIAYTVPLSLMFLAFASAINIYKAVKHSNKVIWTVSAGFLFFIASGSPLFMSALCCSVMLFFFLYAFKKKSNSKFYLLAVLGICIASALINALAPGNFVRQNVALESTGSSGIDIALLLKNLFISASNLTLDMSSPLPLVVLMSIILLLIPVAFKMLEKKQFFVSPLKLIVVSIFIYVACLFPFPLGMNIPNMPYRYIMMMTWILVVLFVANSVNIVSFLMAKYGFSLNNIFKRFTIVAIGIVALSGSFLVKPVKSLTSFQIVFAYANGTLHSYEEERMKIYETLINSTEENVALQQPKVDFHILFNLGISENPDSWVNKDVAKYYGKDSVYYLPRE